ncbi:MAG: adenylate/guanylate cyclase domain-containing protein [Candidatus Thiodiazotropha sp. (ex Codakia orbicularis)]|nr:adenylate/guanylate cyclase domain-containing protein [Candidatus Thiodiazotropha sp. (ex Codakia orbicularis)]
MNFEAILRSAGLGLFIGLCGIVISFSPGSAAWEENIGLSLLFELRGQRPPPSRVVIVSINGETAEQLGLGEEIPHWPRSIHASLIDRLNQAGVAVIAFDIFFKKARPPGSNESMVRAIRDAGNVLLVAYLQQQRILDGQTHVDIERLIPPTEQLAEAALGIAPFVLPKIPVRVSRFWTFTGENRLMSLPAAALQLIADPDGSHLRNLLQSIGEKPSLPSDWQSQLHAAREIFNDSSLQGRLLEAFSTGQPTSLNPSQRSLLRSLLTLYTGHAYPYINFYGPPGTIPTIPIDEIIGAPPGGLDNLKDKVVFIGYAGTYQPKQKDGFYTVYSQPNGLDLSGVEIAATAFANLLAAETLSPLGRGSLAMLLLGYGMAITLLFRWLPGLRSILMGLVICLLYLTLAYGLFEQQNLWLPWFVPVALQTPLALILSQTWHYRQMRSSRERLRELFGYYLPGDVIDQLAQHKKEPMTDSSTAFGVCLATDAQSYTEFAESLDPVELQNYLNRYYEILFKPVRARNGVVSDVVGDAMLAIWPSTEPDPKLHQMACEAGLAINRSLQQSDLEPKLFTRIGLHAGELVMSHVGAIDHFEYRAVGDMVNTTSRIENLNKLLGTSILASSATVDGLKGIATREVGQFVVAGKQLPITIHEVAAMSDEVSPGLRRLHADFADALAAWMRGDRESSYEKFKRILAEHPDDGPTQYYVEQYRERRKSRKNLV